MSDLLTDARCPFCKGVQPWEMDDRVFACGCCGEKACRHEATMMTCGRCGFDHYFLTCPHCQRRFVALSLAFEDKRGIPMPAREAQEFDCAFEYVVNDMLDVASIGDADVWLTDDESLLEPFERQMKAGLEKVKRLSFRYAFPVDRLTLARMHRADDGDIWYQFKSIRDPGGDYEEGPNGCVSFVVRRGDGATEFVHKEVMRAPSQSIDERRRSGLHRLVDFSAQPHVPNAGEINVIPALQSGPSPPLPDREVSAFIWEFKDLAFHCSPPPQMLVITEGRAGSSGRSHAKIVAYTQSPHELMSMPNLPTPAGELYLEYDPAPGRLASPTMRGTGGISVPDSSVSASRSATGKGGGAKAASGSQPQAQSPQPAPKSRTAASSSKTASGSPTPSQVPAPSHPAGDYASNSRFVLIAAAAIGCVLLVVGVVALVCWLNTREKIERADELAAQAMEELRIYKTHLDVPSGKDPDESLEQAVLLATQARNVYETPKSTGTHAMMQAYEARLNWGGEHLCDKKRAELVQAGDTTLAVVERDEVTAEGHMARALWAFKDCQCQSVWNRGDIADSCDSASEQFSAAFDTIESGEELDWFRFEVAWQWQMHELVLGHSWRKAGDETRAAEVYESSLQRCNLGAPFADAAPINDAELYKNCMRAAAAVRQWDMLAEYTVELAELDPGLGARSSVGPLPALARSTSFRDPSCEEIIGYTDTSYRKRSGWLQGYPRARRGQVEDRFCIGWAYAQLGCVTKANRELGSYLRYSSSGMHREEAEELRAALATRADECLVPGY